MRCLGLDPGVERLGFGIVDGQEGSLACPKLGVIYNTRGNKSFTQYLSDSIRDTALAFSIVVETYQPTFCASEIVPVGKLGSRTELVVACITACYTWAVSVCHLDWYWFGANTVKKVVAGDGTATKPKVRNAVIAMFPEWGERHAALKLRQKEAGERRPPGIPQDAFDGAAVAMTAILQGVYDQ